MPSFNKVELLGNITRDPELRFTNNGIPVANFGLAVNRVRSKNDEVDFFDLTAWRGVGETIANYKKKGDPVFVEGRLEQQSWEDKQTGATRTKHVVVVENIQFLSGGNGGASEHGEHGDNGSHTSGQTAGVGASVDEDMETDIPF